MKRFLMSIIALMCVCGAQAQSEEVIPWPLEPKNERVEYMLSLEAEDVSMMGERYMSLEMAQMMMGIQDEDGYETPEQLQADVNAMYERVDVLWHKFVWLCNENRFKEAIELYRDNQADLYTTFQHSMVRFTFHYEVIGFLAYDYLPEDEARALMIKDLTLDCMVLGIKYGETGDDDYLDYYDEAFFTLVELCYQVEEYQTILDHIELREMVFNQVGASADKIATLHICKAEIYFAMGDTPTAHEWLIKGKQLLEERLSEDVENEDLRSAIEEVDNLIEFTANAL